MKNTAGASDKSAASMKTRTAAPGGDSPRQPSQPEKKSEHIDALAQAGFEAAIFAHDLSNVVGGMIGYVQLAQMTGDPEEMQKCIRVVGDGVKREKDLITAFKAGLGGKRTLCACNLKEEIEDALGFFDRELKDEGISWTLSGPGRCLMIEPKAFRRAILVSVTALAAHLGPSSQLLITLEESGSETAILMNSLPGGKPVEPQTEKPRISDTDLHHLKTMVFEAGGRLDLIPSGFRFAFPVI